MRYLVYLSLFAMLGFSSFTVHAQESTGTAANPSLDELLQQLGNTSDTNTGSAQATTTTTTTTDTHDAPQVLIQNMSYTFQDSVYTITWSPIQGSTKIDVSVKNADTDMDYTKVSTVAASAGSTKVNLTSQGTYIIKLTPVDDLSTALGPDQSMTIKVEAPTQTPTTPKEAEETVQTPPQVGPAQDLLFGGLILIAIVYFVYRFRSNEN